MIPKRTTKKSRERMLRILQIMSDDKAYTNNQLGDLLRIDRRSILSSTTALVKLQHIKVVGKTFGKKSSFTHAFVGGLGRENVNLYQITPEGRSALAAAETETYNKDN
jgi:hypothetical protein